MSGFGRTADHGAVAERQAESPPVLQVEGLHIEIVRGQRKVLPVRGLDVTVGESEVTAVVGESGSGKSVSARAMIGILPRPGGRVTRGSIRLKGRELVGLSERRLAEVRGSQVGMVFQDPLSSMNPVMTVGRQISEVVERHLGASRRAGMARAREMLELVGVPDARHRIYEYPHQFSGGMRQRAMIAAALAAEPDLLIADEPTTALDVTTQAQIIELLGELQSRLGMSVLLITHDLGVAAMVASRVAVMYAGRVVEYGPSDQVLGSPHHPYTQGLLGSVPRIDQPPGTAFVPIEGNPPDLASSFGGCPFAPRCDRAISACDSEDPPLTNFTDEHGAACLVAAAESGRHTRPADGGEYGMSG